MDTSTLMILLGVIAVLLVVVVFFVTRGLLLSTFSRQARTHDNKKFRPTFEANPKQTYPYPVSTPSNSDEFEIVSLPLQRSKKPGFSGYGEDINLDGTCTLKGRIIRDCIKDCNCEEYAELRQRHRRKVY